MSDYHSCREKFQFFRETIYMDICRCYGLLILNYNRAKFRSFEFYRFSSTVGISFFFR
jgi:hypothetical protein